MPTAPGDYAGFYAGVAATVRDGVPPPVALDDAIDGLRIIEAAFASSRAGVVTRPGAAPGGHADPGTAAPYAPSPSPRSARRTPGSIVRGPATPTAGDPTVAESTHAWQDTSLPPRERAEKLVAAMTLEQKIAQLHGAMETIDIYAMTAQAAESGADMDQLAAQIQIERHVPAIDELGIPRFRITNGPVGVGMGDGDPEPARHVPADDDRPRRRLRRRAGARLRGHHRLGDGDAGPARPGGPRRVPASHHDRRSQLRVLLRGPVPVRRDGRRGDQGDPGPRRHRDGQALRGQRPGVRAVPGQRRGRRARPARALPAAVRDAGQGRRDRRDHERLQPRAGRVRHRIPVHADRHPAHRVGLRGLRAVRLLVVPLAARRR